MPLSIPGAVEIRTVEDDDDMMDETEVKTLSGDLPDAIAAALRAMPAPPQHGPSQPPPPPRPRPAAGTPASAAAAPATAASASPVPPPDDDDDGVTTQAVAPRVGSAAAIDVDVDELATRPGIEEPATKPGVGSEPETSPRAAPRPAAGSDYEPEDSITTRGPAVDYADEGDDSVTAQAPLVPKKLIAEVVAQGGKIVPLPDAIEDGTEGTTQRVRKSKLDAASASPADEEAESITTQAPGPLTNMLRVIASDARPSSAGDDEDEAYDDDLPENRTAVMANAPMRLAAEGVVAESAGGGGPGVAGGIRPTGPVLPMPQPHDGRGQGARAVAAPQLQPSSESGLRVARPNTGEERASLGVLGVHDGARNSGISRSASPTGGSGPHAMSGGLHDPPYGPSPLSLHDVDLGKGPRYGLIVAIVALISVAVPVTLYVVLSSPRGDEGPVATPAEVVKDFQKHDGPRQKYDKSKPPPAAASASASGSASHKGPPPRGPFRR